MQEVDSGTAVEDFQALLTRVCKSHLPISIVRPNSEAVVMLPLSAYNSLLETAYLLKSPANADHLRKSVKEAEEGELIAISLEDL